jgi:hypothetical protein
MDDRARAPIPEGYLPLTPAVLDIMVALDVCCEVFMPTAP